jgi:hypothetical protein
MNATFFIRSTVIALIAATVSFAIGYQGGSEQAILKHHNHPACNSNLYPPTTEP